MITSPDIELAYTKILGRSVDCNGLENFKSLALAQKITFGRLLHLLCSSEEFAQKPAFWRDQALAYRDANSHKSEAFHWRHTISLSDGFKTNGIDCQERISEVIFSESVFGRTILDIGAYNGYLAFESERRGASSVFATDIFNWNEIEPGNKAAFDYARRDLGSAVRVLERDAAELRSIFIGTFDVVLFTSEITKLETSTILVQDVCALARERLVIVMLVEPAIAVQDEGRSKLNNVLSLLSSQNFMQIEVHKFYKKGLYNVEYVVNASR